MWLRWLAVAVLALLVLHSASYGGGFVADPEGMAQEFGENEPGSEAAANLTGLLGVILLVLAATSTGAAWLLVKRRPEGPWLAGGIAIALLSIGLYWAFAGSAWDAWFYSAAGFLLLTPSALMLANAHRARHSS